MTHYTIPELNSVYLMVGFIPYGQESTDTDYFDPNGRIIALSTGGSVFYADAPDNVYIQGGGIRWQACTPVSNLPDEEAKAIYDWLDEHHVDYRRIPGYDSDNIIDFLKCLKSPF